MGFFGALLDAVASGVSALFSNPLALGTLGAVSLVALMAGAPLALVAGIAVAFVAVLGILAECDKCNDQVSRALDTLNQFLNQHANIMNVLPSGIELDSQASNWKINGTTTEINAVLKVKFNSVSKLGDLVQQLNEMLLGQGIQGSGKDGSAVEYYSQYSGDTPVILVGNPDFSSAELVGYLSVRDGKTGETKAVTVRRSSLRLGVALLSFKILPCDLCGGADSKIDEYARARRMGFIRRLVFWTSKDLVAEDGGGGYLKDEYRIIANTVVLPDDTLEVVYGTPVLLYYFYRACHSSDVPSQLKPVCDALSRQTVCPYGVVYLPDVFIDVLRQAGYASYDTVLLAKVMATSMTTTTLRSTFLMRDMGAPNVTASVSVKYRGSDGQFHETDVDEATTRIDAVDIAVLKSTVPFSFRMDLVASGESVGSNSGRATVYVDPQIAFQAVIGGTPDSLPKVVVHDAYGRTSIEYLGGCFSHIAGWDDSRKKIVVYGPKAPLMVSVVKELYTKWKTGEVSKVSCPLFKMVVSIATQKGCTGTDGDGRPIIRDDCIAPAGGE